MSFLGLPPADMALLGAALGGAMVLLYVLKLRRRRVEVPFAPLWAQVVEERQSTALFQHLKRLLSLLVQLTILALLVVALGDPRPDGSQGCGFAPPAPPPERHSLLLLDASASMASFQLGQTRIQAAAREAHDLVDRMGANPAHRVMVATVDGTVRPLTLWTTDRRQVHDAIDAYLADGARDTPTDVDEALAMADQTLRGRADGEVVFVTDRAFPPVDAARAESLRLRVVPVGSPGDNVGIEAFNVRPYLDDSLTYAIYYAVKNHTDRALKATLLLYANERGHAVEDFVSDERIVASFALELPAAGILRDVVGDVGFEGSRLLARVVVDPAEPTHDVFPRDDVAFALVPERHQTRVQLVTEGNLFLHASLFVRENVDFTVVSPEAYAGPDGYDVTVVDGVALDMTRPGRYFLLDPRAGGPFEVTGALEEPEVVRTREGHAILRNLKLVDLGIAEASVLEREKGDVIVAAARGDVPLIMTRFDEVGQRAFAVVAFDIRKSLLPLNYAFPLLVVNVLNWFQPQPDGLVPTYRAGTPLSVATTLPPGELVMKGPGEAARSGARGVAGRVHLLGDRIGIYHITPPADLESDAGLTLALNLLDADEGRISPQGEYPAWEAPPPWTPPEPPWPGTPWRVLLVGALAIVAIEWLTWHRRLTV